MRVKVCASIDEALAAQAAGALLWWAWSVEKWVPDLVGWSMKYEGETRRWLDMGYYGYYVDDEE